MAEATRFETTKPAADRILIVEDEENARIGYEALLRRWGYEVLGVGSAEDALARFSEFAPAVVDRRRGIARDERPGPAGAARRGIAKRSRHHHHGQGQRRAHHRRDRSRRVLVYREAAQGRGVAIAAGPRAGPRARSAAGGGAHAAVARNRKTRRPGRRIESHAGRHAPGRAGRAVLGIRADHGRNRIGQGNSGAHDSPALAARGAALSSPSIVPRFPNP